MRPSSLFKIIAYISLFIILIDGGLQYILLVGNHEDATIITTGLIRGDTRKLQIAETVHLSFLVYEVVALIVLGVVINKKMEEEERMVGDLQKFKSAVDGASDYIVITDQEGTVIYGNNAIEKTTGFKVEEVIGKKAGKLWGKQMDKQFYDEMWQTIKYDKKVFTGVIKNKRKNGEDYDAAVSISPILDKKGEPIFFVGIERDVTKDVALDRAKTEFVSLASHQLRTPLTAVSWYTELLRNGEAGKLTRKENEYLDEIARGTRRMVELVNSLLDVSRMGLGTFTINSELADICVIMEGVIKGLKAGVIKNKINLNYVCGEKIPKVMLDQKLTRFIFQNLLSNAIKYSREQGVIKIDMVLEGKNILISFADNGLGIPQKQQGEIFKKFFRADNVREKDTEGTGLGLYLVKTILGAIGGEVWFESEENVGSTFYVKIPLLGMKGRSGDKTIIMV